MKRRLAVLLFATVAPCLLADAAAVSAQPAVTAPGVVAYSDMADLALAAQVAVVVTVTDTVKLKDADAIGVPPGFVRFYVGGDVTALLAGKGGISGHLNWIADVALTAANRPPKLKKAKLILLARPVAGKPSMLQLVAREGQITWTPEAEQRLRAILTQAVAADAPPRIIGVGHAFHVPGSIPGEGETQMFLKTADGRPVSLSVLRRPGEQPRWSVSLGEMVSDSAAAPQPDTLLWYRLACGLPATLPDDSVSDQAPEDAAAARADYAFVIGALGPCRSGAQSR